MIAHEAKGVTLSMETEPGSGVFREVAECVDFMPPLTVGRKTGPLNVANFSEAPDLAKNELLEIKAAWMRINHEAFWPYIEASRKRQSAVARDLFYSQRAVERAQRVRPLRKRIKRFKSKDKG